MNFDHIDPGNAGGSVTIPELPRIAPKPISYPCTECLSFFKTIEELRKHRLDSHRRYRPFLYFRGVPHHLDHYKITERLAVLDMGLQENLWVENNPEWPGYA